MPNYSKLNDHALIELLVSGNEPAFTEIYARYWKKLFTLAANKLSDLEEAEEVVQDIFLSLWNRRNVLNITTSLNIYLATAVKYRVITTLNKRYREYKYTDSLKAQSQLDHSTEQWIEFEELKGRLNKLVIKLPEKCRLVYSLSREHGYSQKRIASELKISEKTVEAHLTKALKSLRAGLTQLFMLLFI